MLPVFIEGMIDFKHINMQIIEPVMEQDLRQLSSSSHKIFFVGYKKTRFVPVNDIEESEDLGKILQVNLLRQYQAFLTSTGYGTALLIESKGWAVRGQ